MNFQFRHCIDASIAWSPSIVPSAHYLHITAFMLLYLLSGYYMPGTVTGPRDAAGD